MRRENLYGRQVLEADQALERVIALGSTGAFVQGCYWCGDNVESRPGDETTMGFFPYVDLDDPSKTHTHDPNKRDEVFDCECGRRWVDKSVKRCWCGWHAELRTVRGGIIYPASPE